MNYVSESNQFDRDGMRIDAQDKAIEKRSKALISEIKRLKSLGYNSRVRPIYEEAYSNVMASSESVIPN